MSDTTIIATCARCGCSGTTVPIDGRWVCVDTFRCRRQRHDAGGPSFRECQGCGTVWHEPDPEHHFLWCPTPSGRCPANTNGKCRPDYQNGVCLDCGARSGSDGVSP